jgi:N-glycosylase/DNA lyase
VVAAFKSLDSYRNTASGAAWWWSLTKYEGSFSTV